MGTLHGSIIDAATGQPLDAKVHVLSAMGRFLHPQAALLKRGQGTPFFFCHGQFELDAPRGRTDILVERGTEYEPLRVVVDVPEQGLRDAELILKRWHTPQDHNWYPGNTHIHYDQHETRPDDRLAVDCSVEGYNVTCVSVLDRRQLPYASNKYPLGVMNEFTTAHHVLDIGEENRHYAPHSPWGFGYGHVMFLNIRNLVQPVSRGHILASQFDPDWPPLCFCCDDARDQGGLVIWCHNGKGMEAPVAAALGKLDAFNLFDPFWMDPEYDIWYRLLNCGLHLPASTGTDWFVCSNNRVYVKTPEAFSYGAWIDGMKAGNTFITNGPTLTLTANGQEMGTTVELSSGGAVEVEVTWSSYYPVQRVEVIHNGEVVATQQLAAGNRSGSLRHGVDAQSDGWVAARCWSDSRDSFDHSIFAHTSPVYVKGGPPPAQRDAAARYFIDALDRSLEWIDSYGRYNNDQQRKDVRELFRRGREVYSAAAGAAR